MNLGGRGHTHSDHDDDVTLAPSLWIAGIHSAFLARLETPQVMTLGCHARQSRILHRNLEQMIQIRAVD